MLNSVFLKTLRDRRRGFIYWALGLVAFIAMEVAVYPTVRDNPEFKKLSENYPDAVKSFFGFGGQFDITSGAGFLGIEAFSMIVPLILIFCTVAAGASARGVARAEGRACRAPPRRRSRSLRRQPCRR